MSDAKVKSMKIFEISETDLRYILAQAEKAKALGALRHIVPLNDGLSVKIEFNERVENEEIDFESAPEEEGIHDDEINP